MHGTLRDAAGKPVAKAELRLQSRPDARVRTTATDDRGEFRFPALPPGVYELRTSMAGYREANVPSIFLRPGESKAVDLALEALKPPPQSAAAPAFYDEPQFTVSGVTDATSLGGHGSDTVVHARDSLARDTAALAKPEHAYDLKADERNSAYELALAAYDAGDLQRARTLASTMDNDARAHHLLADVQEKLGNSLDAVREFQRAAEMEPSEPYLFDWGAELLLHRAPEPASQVFSNGHVLFPKSARMLIGLGAASFARGSYDQAVLEIGEACDLDPSNPSAYQFLGKIDRSNSTVFDGVLDRLQRIVALHPENAEANYGYAMALWKRRKSAPSSAVGQMESLLNAASQLDPKFAPTYLQLGIVHADSREFSKAIADYQRAIEFDAQSDEAHYRLAQAYRQIGQTEKAKAEIDLYEQLAKANKQKEERERHEIQQFVYTLRDRLQQ